jgi:two-component system sensor histidine kinase/response regulator
MEQANENELKNLRSANAFKDKLFAIIGHDLKSPLNNVKGTILLLQDDTLSPNERKEILSMLLSSVDNSLQVLNNLLDWASQKYYGGILNVKTKDERLSMFELVNQSISFVKYHAVKKIITVTNKVPLNVFVNADLQQMLFILRNLISNAIKFSYENAEVIVEAVLNGKVVETSIIDLGTGISDKRISSLFQIDTRSSQEGTSNEKGAGLGLILCKEFVEDNGGEIWITSDGKIGTIVKFTTRVADDI